MLGICTVVLGAQRQENLNVQTDKHIMPGNNGITRFATNPRHDLNPVASVAGEQRSRTSQTLMLISLYCDWLCAKYLTFIAYEGHRRETGTAYDIQGQS